jgi:hypothetical protein
MLATKIFLLLNLLFSSIIVGQAYMYIIALTDVQKNLDGPAYIRLRQLIDRNFMAKYKYVIYASMVSAPLLCILVASEDPTGLLFACSLIALIAFIIDLILTVKGNLPINKMINGWPVDNYPSDWERYREKWLRIYSYRQTVNIIGFISLLIGAIFRS